MKLIFFGKGNRGVDCLWALQSLEHDVRLVVTQPESGDEWYGSIEKLAKSLGIPIFQPADPNTVEAIKAYQAHEPDVFVLAGYGKILRQRVLTIPNLISINLHAGKLPEYRGSSPLNWALINGEDSFSLSIIAVDEGIDTGDILKELTFPIGQTDTIEDLHHIANEYFPKILVEVLEDIAAGTLNRVKQAAFAANYYPLRFPDDGIVVWDMSTSEQVHNKIRALTVPYPCAFTFNKGRKIKLISSNLESFGFRGEPGKIYRIGPKGLLVCASDKCLWITEAVYEDNGESVFGDINRYESFSTVRGYILGQERMTKEDIF